MKEGHAPTSPLMATLVERGFVHQATDMEGLDRLAAAGPIAAYIGFDLTAPSLHVGSLIQLMVLRHLKAHGHEAVVVFGDATTRVGDPSDKNGARPVLSPERIEENRIGIVRVVDRVVGPCRHVHNSEWLESMSFMDFLQGPARQFTLNRMLSLDIVSRRLEQNLPMTIMELCYSMMQGMDFAELARRHDVRVQIGGSDQWSNILAGMELARRDDGRTLFGLTTPLLLDPQGRKMGKTADGQAIWLDGERTSAFELWQFFRNVPDELVEQFLGLFTDIPMDAVRGLASRAGGELNQAKAILAVEAVSVVHGRGAALAARDAARVAFEGGEGVMPSIDVAPTETIVDALLKAGFATSRGDARRLAKGGGVKVDGVRVDDVDVRVGDAFADAFRLTAGRKRVVAVNLLKGS
jgi:tyrosyl-tRNA synthetase